MTHCPDCRRPFRSTGPGLAAELTCKQRGNTMCRVAKKAFEAGIRHARSALLDSLDALTNTPPKKVP